jgi:mRNA interferase MazF
VNPKRGEVWLVDLGIPKGYEQAGERPAVVIQTDDLSRLSTVIVIPLTTAHHETSQRGTVILPVVKGTLEKKSVALCYQIRALDKYRLKKRLGELPSNTLLEIETTTAYVLGLAI